jgi:hypothetical protein
VDAIAPNRAFESGRADQQRAFGLRPRRRAAQRERWAAQRLGHLGAQVTDAASGNCTK